jgi:hypothetical protein
VFYRVVTIRLAGLGEGLDADERPCKSALFTAGSFVFLIMNGFQGSLQDERNFGVLRPFDKGKMDI